MKHRTIIALFLAVTLAAATPKKDGDFLSGYMREKGLTGTIVLESLKSGKKYVHNGVRAGVRYTPASTFKIVNTLIALQEKAVADENEIIKWDGREKGFRDWNRDQTLADAFSVSCVWFYQDLAVKIGHDRYREYLRRTGYGNAETGASVDTFWLDGSLQISALEQIEVLKNIYLEKYPFEKKNYDILKKVMVVEKTGSYTMRAKTGTAARVMPVMGWYVGYVETKDDAWFFACNIDMPGPEYASLRKETVYAALREAGVL